MTTWTIILVISVITPRVCQAANCLMTHFISDKWRMFCNVCSFFYILGMLASRAMRRRENTSPATSITCKLLMIMMPHAVCHFHYYFSNTGVCRVGLQAGFNLIFHNLECLKQDRNTGTWAQHMVSQSHEQVWARCGSWPSLPQVTYISCIFC